MKAEKHSPDCSLCEFESRFVRPRKGLTLVVGSKLFGTREDRRRRYPKAIGIDMQAGAGVDHVANLEETSRFGPFAHVDCLSVLEHARRPWLLAANLERMMKPGATIYVTAPFIWRVHNYPADYWRFTLDGIRALFPGIEWAEMGYAGARLRRKRVDTQKGEHPFLARTEVCAFGHKACASS